MEESDHNLYNLLGLGPKAKDTEVGSLMLLMLTLESLRLCDE